MEQQIQDLINSIKKDGIDCAEEEKKKIIEEAEKERDRIISEAKKERDNMLKSAMNEVEKEKERNNEALRLAARDLSLSFKKEVEKKLQAILDEKIVSAFDGELLKDTLKTVINAEFTSGAVVTLPEDAKAKLSTSLVKELTKELGEGVEIVYSKDFGGGFKVMDKDGKAYIDLTDDETVKLLYPYLSSKIRELI